MYRRGGRSATTKAKYIGLYNTTTRILNNDSYIQTKRWIKRAVDVVKRDQNDIEQVLAPTREGSQARNFLSSFDLMPFYQHAIEKGSIIRGVPKAFIIGSAFIILPTTLSIARYNSDPIRTTAVFVKNLSLPSQTFAGISYSSLFSCIFAGGAGFVYGTVRSWMSYAAFVDKTRFSLRVPHTRQFFRYIQARSFQVAAIYGVATAVMTVFVLFVFNFSNFYLSRKLFSPELHSVRKTNWRGDVIVADKAKMAQYVLGQSLVVGSALYFSLFLAPFLLPPLALACGTAGFALLMWTAAWQKRVDHYVVYHPDVPVRGGPVGTFAQLERKEELRMQRLTAGNSAGSKETSHH